MRELRFRAWDNQRREWIQIESINWDWFRDGEQSIFDGSKHHMGNYTLEQFTGKLDANGVEIYEGDVICKVLEDGERIFYSPVIYESPCFTLRGYDNGDYYVGDCAEYHPWGELEVVGNIHENKELLEEK